MTHRVVQRFGKSFLPGARGPRAFLGADQLVSNAEIGVQFRSATTAARDQIRARGEGTNIPVESKGFRHCAPDQETHRPGWLGRDVYGPALEQGFDLGSKTDCLAVVSVVERLDAERIASQKK